MEKKNKKEEILLAALDLFSTYGYEATSTAMIADAVGIKKASLYFHFESKEDILDTVMAETTKQYEAHSVFARADWTNSDELREILTDLSPENIREQVVKHLQMIIHNPNIRKIRRLMCIEQFRNEDFAKSQSKRQYEDVYKFSKGLIKYMIDQKLVKDCDYEILAAQFAFPISMWLSVIDREPEREEELLGLVNRHIKQFFETYSA